MNPMKRKKLYAIAQQKAAMAPATELSTTESIIEPVEELTLEEVQQKEEAAKQAMEDAKVAAEEAKLAEEEKAREEKAKSEQQRALLKQQYKEAEKCRREDRAAERGIEFDLVAGEDPEDVKREALRELAKEEKA